MKKDLDYIFKKIKIIRTKLSQQYPQAYNGNFIFCPMCSWSCGADILLCALLYYAEAVRSSLAEEVIVEDTDQGPKPLEPEVIPQSQASADVVEKDADSDGNE